MEHLQDYLISVDTLKRLRRLPAYGGRYTRALISKVKKNKGLILLAYNDRDIAGCIAGIIERQSKDNLLECVPTKVGRVLELVVFEGYRRQGLGGKLMKRMETYFRRNGCDTIRVEVFEPNRKARGFYHRSGYQDRVVDIIKRIG